MKRIILFFTTCIFFFTSKAQELNIQSILIDASNEVNIETITSLPKLNHHKKSSRANSRWYSYLESMDTFNANSGGLSFMINSHLNSSTIWQDTTLKLGYTGTSGTTYAGVRNKGFGQAFDPVSIIFNSPNVYPNEMKITRADAYTIDSMELVCKYYRVPTKPNIVDTLILSVCYGTGSATSDMHSFYYTAPNSTQQVNFLTDTLRYMTPKFSFQNYACKGPTTIIKKIPLTAATGNDTTTGGFNIFQVPIGLSVPNANIVGAFVMFKSGDTWIPNADSVYKYNRMHLYSFEENIGAFHSYFKNDYNSSHLFRNDTTGWGDNPLPSFAFTAPYALEYHWMAFKVTSDAVINLGLNDKNILQAQVFPNPNNGILNINLQENCATQLQIINMLGQTVFTADLENLSNKIDISKIENGFYQCNLKSKNKITSIKLVLK